MQATGRLTMTSTSVLCCDGPGNEVLGMSVCRRAPMGMGGRFYSAPSLASVGECKADWLLAL